MFDPDCVAHMLVVCGIYFILKSHFLVDGMLNFQEGRSLDFVVTRTRSRLNLIVLEPVNEFDKSNHGEYLSATLHSNDRRIIIGYFKSDGFFLAGSKKLTVLILSFQLLVPDEHTVGVLIADLAIWACLFYPSVRIDDLAVAQNSLIKYLVTPIIFLNRYFYSLLNLACFIVILSRHPCTKELLRIELFLF